jgi:hypothetical protein
VRAEQVEEFSRILRRTPFGAHPGLLFCPELEGYRYLSFGGRAGPSVAVTHLFHELAHAAEFGPDEYRRRSTRHGFVFRTRRACIGAEVVVVEPLTTQSIERELRTFAHQYHLQRLAGITDELEAFAHACAKPMAFMPDWLLVPGGQGSWDEREQERRAYCVERIQQYAQAFSAEGSIARLTGWLDCVQRSLRRLKFDRGAADNAFARTSFVETARCMPGWGV